MTELNPPAIDIDHMSLGDLTLLTGATVRTVRYYIAETLLPPPEDTGPKSYYTRMHLDRLRLINRLKQFHLPLKKIQRFVSPMNDETVKEWLAVADKELLLGIVEPRVTLPGNVVPIRAGIELDAPAATPVQHIAEDLTTRRTDMPTMLYRTTVTIWTDEDPRGQSLSWLSLAANDGCGIALDKVSEVINHPENHPEWPEIEEFFGSEGN